MDQVAGMSALLGGCTSLLPNAYFEFRVFGRRSARTNRPVDESAGRPGEAEANRVATVEWGAFYRAEVGKIAVTMILLVMAFSLVEPLNAGALVGGFVLAHLAHILVLMGTNLAES